MRNLGPGAAPLYEREVYFYLSRGCRFIRIRDYCLEMGLVESDDGGRMDGKEKEGWLDDWTDGR